MQIFFKLQDLKSIKGVSQSERRRITGIVDVKVKQIFLAIFFYLISAVVLALGFLFANSIEIFVLSGVLIGCSIFSAGLLLSEVRSITDFTADVENREETKNRQRSAVNRIKSKAKDHA